MEINSVPPIPPTIERTTISNTIHASTEADLQQEFRQSPVPPVVDVESQSQGNETSTERRVEWAQEDRRPIYRVVKRESGEVLTQIPSEEVLRVARKIDEKLHGGEHHAAIDVRS